MTEPKAVPRGLWPYVSPVAIGVLLIALATVMGIFIIAVLGGLSCALGVVLGIKYFWNHDG